jgi:K+-sensing histidine kinase KdpD
MTHPSAPAAGRPAWLGPAVAVVGLAGLTGLLAPLRDSLPLASVALLYLIPVVAVAVVGGVWAALGTAVAADLMVNFFFTTPYFTFVVDDPDNLVALIVYVLIAATVSVAMHIAAQQRAAAARHGIEAALLARITAQPVADHSLATLLEHIRATFALTTVALVEPVEPVEPVEAGEHTVAQVGHPPAGAPVIEIAAADGLRLRGWGPPMFGEDRRLLGRLATAAARTLETQRLAIEAAHARELADIDRLRAALLTAVGHDLRTPLAGIKAAISAIRQPDVELTPADHAELLATAEECTDQLDALVDNLLSMSRLQAGALSVHARPVALDAVAAQALIGIHTHNGQITVDVPDDLPHAHADPGLLERVIANLVTNAQAASPPDDPIHLHARHTGDRIHLAVVDHGRGIPDGDRARIFEPFQRLHDRTTTGGLGLGLAIARGFVEAMGGTITPTGTPGGGLTMTITLPTAR